VLPSGHSEQEMCTSRAAHSRAWSFRQLGGFWKSFPRVMGVTVPTDLSSRVNPTFIVITQVCSLFWAQICWRTQVFSKVMAMVMLSSFGCCIQC
jgi:hypothetical protein